MMFSSLNNLLGIQFGDIVFVYTYWSSLEELLNDTTLKQNIRLIKIDLIKFSFLENMSVF